MAPGERGELVITNLGRWGFPVIRYRTGDLVRVNLERCDCGRTSLRFEGGILGRADDMVTVRGVNVFPAGVENIIRKFAEVDEFRITVNKVKQMDEMDIEVELCEGADPEVVHEIADQARFDAGLPPARASRRTQRAAALRDEGQALSCEAGLSRRSRLSGRLRCVPAASTPRLIGRKAQRVIPAFAGMSNEEADRKYQKSAPAVRRYRLACWRNGPLKTHRCGFGGIPTV